MLNSFVFAVAISILLGFLSGLGIGGGSLLMLWLTNIMQYDFSSAQSINLLFFIPAASIACFRSCRQGKLSILRLLPSAVVGSLSALIIYSISRQWDTNLVKKAYGCLLLIIACKELRWRKK